MRKLPTIIVGSLVLALTLGLTPRANYAQPPTPDLFFSEYIEGSSYNKALEIYNLTGSSVDLSGYKVEKYVNGSPTPDPTPLSLTGSLAALDVFVICHTSFVNPSLCDLISGYISFNGDDAIALKSPMGEFVDIIGQIGFDPGTEWGTGLTSTGDNTLVRKCEITRGDAIGSDPFDPAIEWDGYAMDDFTHLGSHTVCPPAPVCGDGLVEGTEVCDSNSQGCTTGDGYNGTQNCNASCDGWEACVAAEWCGDGLINGPEQCDSGDQNGIACVPEYGGECGYCDSACQSATVKGPYCGDGIQNGEEQCDDGNNVSGDGCSEICLIEAPEYGSISGFKYYDADRDNKWDGWLFGEAKLGGWKIFVDENGNQKYDKGEKYDVTGVSFINLGHYSFEDLLPGEYHVCEVRRLGWQSSLPGHTNCQTVALGNGENKKGVNFGNHLALFRNWFLDFFNPSF